MESTLIWLGTLAIIAIIVVPYYIKFRQRSRVDLDRKKEAALLGADRPIAQYPLIDVNICIGCGSCVRACPEREVLGIVFGKATIINGLKCIGHGLCEQACPVGAIQVGLGDIKNRDDIPILSNYNETNIHNLYIAGELGGFALIRNAIRQGEMVGERIAELVKKSRDRSKPDIIIIGAGPAGMSAALTAIKNGLSYIVIDQQGTGGTILQYPRKKIVLTQRVQVPLYGMLEKSEYSKEELLDIWLTLKQKHHVNVLEGEKLKTVQKYDSGFRVITQNNQYESQFVVLALGRRGTPRKLGVPGEEQAKVMYKLLDAESYQNEHLLVVGGGDSAIEAAMGLAQQTGNTVTISYRKGQFFRIKRRNAERVKNFIESGRIKVLYNSNVKNIGKKSVLIDVEGREVELKNDYVFIFAGGVPPFKLLKEIGIQFGGEDKSFAIN